MITLWTSHTTTNTGTPNRIFPFANTKYKKKKLKKMWKRGLQCPQFAPTGFKSKSKFFHTSIVHREKKVLARIKPMKRKATPMEAVQV